MGKQVVHLMVSDTLVCNSCSASELILRPRIEQSAVPEDASQKDEILVEYIFASGVS